MSQKMKLWCWRTGLICIEGLAVVAVLCVLIISLAAWRLSSGPLDISFAEDYIEQRLQDSERGLRFDIERIMLQWPDFSGPLLFEFSNLKLRDAEGRMLLGVDEAGLSVSKSHLLIGRIAPIELALNKPFLRVQRQEDKSFDIGFINQKRGQEEKRKGVYGPFLKNAQPAAPVEISQDSDPAIRQKFRTDKISEYIARPGSEAEKTSAFGALQSLKIEQAHIYYEDKSSGFSYEFPQLDVALKRLDEGLSADFYWPLDGDAQHQTDGRQSYAKGEYMFLWDGGDINAHTVLKNFNLKHFADHLPLPEGGALSDLNLSAEVYATLDSDLSLTKAKLDLESVVGSLSSSELYDTPLPYEDFSLHAVYEGEKQRLSIQEADITLSGVKIEAEAQLFHAQDEGQQMRINGPVMLKIPTLQQAQIAPLWPKSLRGKNSELWLVQLMSQGTFTDAHLSMDVDIQHDVPSDAAADPSADDTGRWRVSTRNGEGAFAFENLSVNYREPLFPVSGATGHGVFNENEDTLRIDIEQGQIKDLNVEKSTLQFYNLIKPGRPGRVDIDVNVNGPVQTLIAYMSEEPISLDHKFDVKRIEGVADANVQLSFPTSEDLKMEEVKVGVEGSVNNVLLPALVEGLDVTGGPFKVSLKDGAVDISGQGKLAGRALKARYETWLDSAGKDFDARTQASLIVDKSLRDHFGVDLSDFLEGSAPVELTYTEYKNGVSKGQVNVDLTPVHVFIEPFKYDKPVGGKAQASLKLELKDGIVNAVKDLTASAPGLSIEKTTLGFRRKGEESELAKGDVSRFVLGETISNLNFDIAPNGVVRLNMNAPFFDARPFLDDDEEGKGEPNDNPPMIITLSADQMRSDQEQTVQYVKIYMELDDLGRFNQFEVDALAGAGDIYLRFKPDETGKRIFKFEAGDAGAALRAFGVTDKVRGGKISIYGEPVRGPQDRDILGTAQITDFKMVKAPILAKLLGAMSLPGALDLLGSGGVKFTKLESKFSWGYRPQGSLITLEGGRTSGNALGLTFDGTLDNAADTMNISGTIVPISGLNKALSGIPVLGTILSGGSDSIFAATYTMKGDAEDPDILVNPLAALTPGLIRRILFE